MAIKYAAAWRVVGVTAVGGCAFAAGLAVNGATVQQSLVAGSFIWVSALGVASAFLCIRWLGRQTRVAGAETRQAVGRG